jgi:CMP-N-acetylneuraminic acid synthetase
MYKDYIGIVGARSGSKRIPNKNIKNLIGMPLIFYSLYSLKENEHINKIVVSTDSQDISNIVHDFDSDIEIIKRPKSLAKDNSTDIEWILHLLYSFYKKYKYYPKYLVFLRPTTPFREKSIINKAIESFNPKNTSLRSIEPLPEAIEKTFRINKSYLLVPSCNIKLKNTNKPNHTFPITYKGNGYIDILKSDYILKYKELYGNKIQAFVTPRTIEIDTPEDWEFAERAM